MPTLIVTIGGATSNSYETHEEANVYFEERVPIVPAWIASGQEASLIHATRLLDALAQPFKTFIPGECGCGFYRVRRQWTGSPATTTQRLAWPRVGMYDQNGNPLDVAIESVAATDPGLVTTATPHRLATGQTVLIFGVLGVLPITVNGEQTVTVIGDYTFSLDGVAVTLEGLGGRVTVIPQALKDAESELAGQLRATDRTLDNDIFVQGIQSVRAGSVSVSFTGKPIPQVIPQAVYDLLPYGWLTDELLIPAMAAMFDVVSD